MHFCSPVPWLVGLRMRLRFLGWWALLGGFPVQLPESSRTCLAKTAAGSSKRAGGRLRWVG